MMKNILLILFLFGKLFATSPDSLAQEFFRAFIDNDSTIVEHFLEAEIAVSQRLGINYDGIDLKILIGKDLPATVPNSRKNNFKYSLNVDDEQRFVLSISKSDRTQTNFYFDNGKVVSAARYYSRDWITLESRYFRFFLSNSRLTNSYAVQKLDQFVEETCAVLGMDNSELELLKKRKIHYFLCEDEDKVEKITGFKIRGMYDMAYDYIISSYNSHYHEIVHLMMNFKLRKLPIYTTPVLQEGIAVYLGGRGGRASNIILNMGKFLIDGELCNIEDFLTKEEFYHLNPSISYPIAGLFVKYLIEEMDIPKFVEMYRSYSSAEFNKIPDIDTLQDKIMNNWNKFLSVQNEQNINPIANLDISDLKMTYFDDITMIYEDNENYYFKTNRCFVFQTRSDSSDYISEVFRNQIGERYRGWKYLFKIEEGEVSLYNLWTNTLIGKYASGFSNTKSYLDTWDKMHFKIPKSVFDEMQMFNKLNYIGA